MTVKVTIQSLVDGISEEVLTFDLPNREGAIAFIAYLKTIATLVQSRDLTESPAIKEPHK